MCSALRAKYYHSMTHGTIVCHSRRQNISTLLQSLKWPSPERCSSLARLNMLVATVASVSVIRNTLPDSDCFHKQIPYSRSPLAMIMHMRPTIHLFKLPESEKNNHQRTNYLHCDLKTLESSQSLLPFFFLPHAYPCVRD